MFQFQISPNPQMPGQSLELILKASGNGKFFAKKGSMIAQVGSFKHSKVLLSPNNTGVMKSLVSLVARKVTGENLEIMEVSGQGDVYLADKGSHVTIIQLQPNGPLESISVESEDLLAFTPECQYGVTPVLTGVLQQKGFFTSKLSFGAHGAQVAIKTNGNPLALTVEPGRPLQVDPDALVAWTGKGPKPKVDVNWKTLIGQTSGESYTFEFDEPGQIVIIQPYERESGLSIGMDDNRYKPEMQNSAFGNTFGGQGNAQTGQQQGGLSGMVGSILGSLK